MWSCKIIWQFGSRSHEGTDLFFIVRHWVWSTSLVNLPLSMDSHLVLVVLGFGLEFFLSKYSASHCKLFQFAFKMVLYSVKPISLTD